MSKSFRSAATVRARITGENCNFNLASVSGSSGLWGSLNASMNFSSLCFIIRLDEVGETAVGERNFAFAIYDVFLQVERYGFRLADVFHGFGNRNPGLFANVEKLSTVVREVKMTAV